MFFESQELIKTLKRKYTKEKIIVFIGSPYKEARKWDNLVKKALKIMSVNLNFDIYIFDTNNDKSLRNCGTVFHYDKRTVKTAMFKIEDLIDAGCKRAFVINADLEDKRLLKEELSYRFLYFSPIEDIYIPASGKKNDIKIGGADLFNFVRDIEALHTEKLSYCNKECMRPFKEHQFKYMEKLNYFSLDTKNMYKHIRVIDALLE